MREPGGRDGEWRVVPAWTLCVLAGGFSRRMGCDKALATFRGATLLERCVRRLSKPGVPVLVATREPGAPGWQAGYPLAYDLLPGEGPLSAMAGALKRVETPYALFVPCDMILLPPDLGDRLLPYASGMAGAAFVREGRVEPFPALVSAEAGDELESFLLAGERRADVWIRRLPARTVPYERVFPEDPGALGLSNANDGESLKRLEGIDPPWA